MYYQNYEDYMRAVLGYPIERQNTYSSFNNTNCLQFNDTNLAIQNAEKVNSNVPMNVMENQQDEFLDMYPEIYRIVNPMVCKVCENNTEPITKELVLRMTDEVYRNLEETEMTTVVNVNATLGNDRSSVANNSNNPVDSKTQNRNVKTAQATQTANQRNTNSVAENRESREIKEARQRRPRNNLLRDLIQILILKRLLERNRPPIIRPPRPPRPPMHPGPSRPPIRPREYPDFYNF